MIEQSNRDKDGNYFHVHENGKITRSTRNKDGSYTTHTLANSFATEARLNPTRIHMANDPNTLQDEARSALVWGLWSILFFWTAVVPLLSVYNGIAALITYNPTFDRPASRPVAIIGLSLGLGFCVPATIIVINLVHFFTGQG